LNGCPIKRQAPTPHGTGGLGRFEVMPLEKV
jgi:hypothetical protein